MTVAKETVNTAWLTVTTRRLRRSTNTKTSSKFKTRKKRRTLVWYPIFKKKVISLTQ